MADPLSCCLDDDVVTTVLSVAGISLLEHDCTLTLKILQGYTNDPYCTKLFSLLGLMSDLVEYRGLLFLNHCLVVPNIPFLCTHFFHLAHDAGGHFGADKTYESLCSSFY